MFIFKFKKQKKQNVRFTEKNVLRLLEDNRYITTAMIQRTYNVGYASAVKMIEILAKKGYIKQNGQRWVTKKIYIDFLENIWYDFCSAFV